MVTAPQSNDPKYLHQRAEEARAHAKQMSNARDKEMMLEIAAKQTMLSVAEQCDRFAIRAAIHSIEEL